MFYVAGRAASPQPPPPAGCSPDPSVRPGEWRWALGVLALAGGLVLAGPGVVGRMAGSTAGLGWETPEGSPSVIAAQHADQFFPGRMRGAIVMAIAAEPPTATVLTSAVAEYSRNISATLGTDERIKLYKPIVLGYYLDMFGRKPPQKDLQAEFVSADERMTVILIQPTALAGVWSYANALLQEFCSSPPEGYTLHITGMPAIMSGDGCSSGVHAKVNTVDMNFECLFKAEVFTLPIALIIIGYIVKFPRLLLVPLLTMVASFIASAALLLPFMGKVPVPKDAIAAMGSVIMATSLDYSLFMLSRFSEEHKHLSLQECVDKIRRHTCRTIFVSGILVAIAFFGSMLLPERNMQGTGFGLGMACLACVATNIVLTPAVLIVGGKFFTGFTFLPAYWGDVNLQGYVGDDDEEDESAQLSRQRLGGREGSFWLGGMRLVERGPVRAVGVVLLLLMPVLCHLPRLNITGDHFAMLPTTMPAVTALRHIQDSFPVGVLDPYAVVITSPLQGGNDSLAEEVKQGAEDLRSHNLLAAAASLGLSSEEADLAAASVELLRDGRGKGTGQEQPSLLAAAAAGVAASAAEKAGRGEALRAAVRAAHGQSANVADMREAVAGAAAAVHAEGGQHAAEVQEAVRSEASKLGLSSEDASKLAASATREGAAPATAAAAAAAAAAALARDKGGLAALMRALGEGWAAGAAPAELAKVLRAVKAAVPTSLHEQILDQPSSPAAGAAEKAAEVGEKGASAAISAADKELSVAVHQKLPLLQILVDAVGNLSRAEHGQLLLPAGYAAMLDLCESLQSVGGVASMVGPSWAYHQPVDWATAVALHANETIRQMYQRMLQMHVVGPRALLEVHTTFPSIGAGASNWVVGARRAIALWEARHPGFRAELAGGAAEAVDIREKIMEGEWRYLGVSVSVIMGVVYLSFRSVMVPLRLAVALLFTLGATFGVGVVIYQTPLLHGLFPNLAYFDGISYEVVPLATGVTIALGLDYDIFLVSRIVELRLQRFSDRASIFRGVLKTGEVISAAGLIMSLAFSGLCFSDKLLFQQLGVLLIISVLFDTFVVRTVLVPALMLVAQNWNWWPRVMPPAVHDVLEGDFETDGGLSRPILKGTSLDALAPQARSSQRQEWHMPGMIA